ncbi:lytic transglycosylase domain-containing protein [Micromonospora okii]|uniref:lytic transglycosylase domain-containing protein n=1 Tax=Micromonospora okii TaxID=1182970 RepID=UPI0035714B8F
MVAKAEPGGPKAEPDTAEAEPGGPKAKSDTPEKAPASEPTAGAGAAAGTATGVADKADAGQDAPDAAKAGGAEVDGAEAGKSDGAKTAKTDAADAGKSDGAEAAKAGGGRGAKAGRVPRRRRVPFAHAVRTPPRQVAVAAARATRAWSRRPSGRLTLSGLFLLALIGATAAAGALVVPATAPEPRPVAVDATDGASVAATAVPPGVVLPGVSGAPLPPGGSGAPLPPGATVPPGGPVATGRPADALAGWAQQVGAKAGISPVAVQAYGYAEMVLAQTTPNCRLSWTTLAAIGYVESRHGQANGATLGPDGRALPEIIGDPLDGQGGRSRIMDTDRGLYDRDTVYDRAIGPMQFIPTTWQEIGADADNDGRKDPHDLDDAALAAGNYLCKGNRNLTVPGDWWGAILSYNDVRRYAQDVFDKANEYGLASRT